jgi:predicted HTH domain antitoxin
VKIEIEVDIPESSVDKMRLQEHLRKEAILALFADGKLPAGAASRELGLTRLQFMELLKQRAIPVITYTYENFQDDLKDYQKLERRSPELPPK